MLPTRQYWMCPFAWTAALALAYIQYSLRVSNIVHSFPLQSGSNLLNYYFNYSISFEQYNQRTLPKMQYLDLEQIFLLNI